MRLWQLISPTLPVGAYAYSQGLEYAIEAGWIKDEATATEWILGLIKNNLSALDVPVFFRLYDAWENKQIENVERWNEIILALRESSELRQEDCDLGKAMKKLLTGLDVSIPENAIDDMAFVTAFSYACQNWSIDRHEAVHGLLWSWCENQVAAAVKLVPLGQTSGQKILSMAMPAIEASVKRGQECEDDAIGLLSPGMAIGSALHETQYTRLFRS